MFASIKSILVCGGRDYADIAKVYAELDAMKSLLGDLLIVTGAAPGADSIAEQWAKNRQVPYLGMPAKWNKYGKAAGFRRNSEMAALAPDFVMAFRGGKGTQSMINLAKKLSLTLILPDGEFWK